MPRLSISELLEDHPYDTEIRVYGKVSLLGELFCPCFELESEGEKVSVWYGLMVEDDSSSSRKRPWHREKGFRPLKPDA